MLKLSKSDLLLITLLILLPRLASFFSGIFFFDFEQYPSETSFSIWARWDSRVYEHISQYGYTAGKLNSADHYFLSHFPPLYPLLVFLFRGLLLSPFPVVAIFASLSGCLISGILLFTLTRYELKSRSAAFWAILFFSSFPTAYFLHVPYAESWFLVFVLSTFYALRVKNNILFASFFTACAILTRLPGITLVPVLFWHSWFFQKNIRREEWCSLILPFFAIGIYALINWQYFGSPVFFLEHLQDMNHTIKPGSFPFREPIESLGVIFSDPTKVRDSFFMMTLGWGAIMMTIVLVVLAAGLRALPIPYHLYTFSYLFLIGLMTWAISTPRYLLSVFPFYLILTRLPGHTLKGTIAILFFLLQVQFLKVFSSGAWAF